MQDLSAPRGVRHLGVELHAVERLRGVLESRNGRIGARRGDPVARRRRIHVIPVAHPDRGLLPVAESVEQLPALDLDHRPAVLPAGGPFDLPAGEMGQQLHAVAEAEHRRPQLEQRRLGGRDVVAVHRIRPARKNDPLRASTGGSIPPCETADGSRSRRGPPAPCRAMSWVYWDPKSTMRMPAWWVILGPGTVPSCEFRVPSS